MRNFEPLNLEALISSKNRDLMQATLQQAILDDLVEVDPDLIVACAEGRLPEPEYQQAMLDIAASPAALDMYLTLLQQQSVAGDPNSDFPEIARSVASLPSFPTAVSGQMAPQKRTLLRRLTLATCILVAFSGLLGAYRQQRQTIAAQRAELLDLQLLTRKASAIALAAQHGTGWLAGRLGPDLLRASLLQYSSSRGDADTTQRPLPGELQLWQKSITELRTSGDSARDADIEDAVRLLITLSFTVPNGFAGEDPAFTGVDRHFAPAEEAIQNLLKEFPADPKVLNLEAILLLAKADWCLGEQRAALETAGRQKLQQIISQHPLHDEALLNLALLAFRSESPSEAAPLLEQFVRQSQDKTLVETVQQVLRMMPK